MPAIRTFGWLGGKAYGNPLATGRQIINRLPWKSGQTYIEPFYGSGAIHLNRRRSEIEIVNDINDRLINWFKVMQTREPELDEILRWTPNSETIFWKARSLLDDEDDLTRAWAFNVAAAYSHLHLDTSLTYQVRWQGRDTSSRHLCFGDHTRKLIAARLQRVQILCRPYQKVLERSAKVDTALIYCDPPYPSARASDDYGTQGIDIAEMTELLLAQQGWVAVSGVEGEWNHLEDKGWHQHPLHRKMNFCEANQPVSDIQECLWTNYQPDPLLF